MTVQNWRTRPYQEIQFIKSDGTVYNLHSPPHRTVRNMTGWGKPPDQKRTISGPYQHGDTYVSYRLTPRTITLDLFHQYISRSELYRGRSELLDQMGLANASPNAPESGVLRWRYLQNNVYTVRDLDVVLEQGLGFTPLDGWREWSVAEGIEFTAHNPVIYDPTVKTATINSWAATMIFPTTLPFVLGAHYGTVNITYAGTWESFPTITITGPTSGIYIENASTGYFLRLDYTVSASETVTITLTYNNRSIVNNAGQSLMDSLSDDSDLGNFSIQTDEIVPNGINTFNVYTFGPDTTTTVVLTYLNRYYGL